jgi:hypothetical protein
MAKMTNQIDTAAYPWKVVTLNRRGRVLSSLHFIGNGEDNGKHAAQEFAANLAYMGGLGFYRVEVRLSANDKVVSTFEV